MSSAPAEGTELGLPTAEDRTDFRQAFTAEALAKLRLDDEGEEQQTPEPTASGSCACGEGGCVGSDCGTPRQSTETGALEVLEGVRQLLSAVLDTIGSSSTPPGLSEGGMPG